MKWCLTEGAGVAALYRPLTFSSWIQPRALLVSGRHFETMRLFICHASEDKEDFVRPLAEELRKKYDVWYDEYCLTLGDSLLGKIDEGLATSDFGVVVLSKAFFGKKWTRAELDGLFAREGPARKIVLPVWKDVSAEEVAGFSPILAGRLAVRASEGLAKVVEEISIAVDVSDRQRALTALEGAVERFKSFDTTVYEKREGKKLLDSTEGVQLISKAFNALHGTFESVLSGVSETSRLLKFNVQMQHGEILIIAAYGLQWGIQMVQLYSNSASEAKLQTTLFHVEPSRFGPRTPSTQLIDLMFRPIIRLDKKVIWEEEPRARIYGNEELVAHLVGLVQKEMERMSREQ